MIRILTLILISTILTTDWAGNDKNVVFKKSKEVISEEDLLISDRENEALKSLIGKSATDLKQEDIELLLHVPVLTLCEIFDYPIPSIEDNWMMGCTVSSDKLRGLVMNAGYDIDWDTRIPADALPASFYIFNNEDLALVGNETMPLGYSFEDIMALSDWGNTEVGNVLYASGYSGEGVVPIEQLDYTKENLHYSFTIDYNWVFSPTEQHELFADLITLTLEE